MAVFLDFRTLGIATVYLGTSSAQARRPPGRAWSAPWRQVAPGARPLLIFVLLLLGSVLGLPAMAVDRAGAAPITLDTIAAQRSEIEQAGSLTDEQKKQASAKLDEARALLEESRRYEAQTQALKTRIREMPEKLADLQKGAPLRQLQLRIEDIAPWTIAQLEVVLNERQQRLRELQANLDEKDREVAAYVAFARTGVSEITKLQERLSDPVLSAPGAAIGGTADGLSETEQTRQKARALMLKANLALLTLQQQNLNVISEVTQLDRDLAADEVTILTEHVAQFREYLQKRRQSDAETTKQAALEALADAPSAIAKLQQTISRLAAEQARLVIREADLDREGERIKRVTDEVQRDYERIQQIAELGGNTAQVSTLLQKRLVFAPSPKALAQQSIEYQGQLSDAALRQLELDELLRDNRDKNSRVAELLAANGVAGEETRDEQRQAAAEAVARHREIVLDLWKTYTRYIGKLSTVEAATRQLLSDTRKYRVFIDDRLLWMPSTEIAPLNEAALLLDGVRWFIDPDHLSVLLSDSLDVLTNSGTSVGFWVLGLIVLLALRKRARHGLSTAAAATQRVRTDSFAATLRAIAGTLVLILPLPWLFIGAGLLLSNQPTVQEYTAVMAVGLQSVGQVLFFLGTLRNLCRTDGLARSHLLWNRTLCDNLGRQAIWLTPLAAPLAFLAIAGAAAVPSAFIRTAASLVPSEQPGVLSLGRLSAIALMVLLAVAVYRIWRKNGPVMLAMAKVPDNAKWANYHILWFGPAILLPLGLALAALSGYYYTVAFLNGKAGETLWFLIILVLLKDLLLRGLYVTQRRLRFEEAVRYREEQITQRAASAEPAASPESGELPLEEDKINYGQLGDQVRKLVQIGYTIGLLVGLWWIWKDVIPAFSFLDKVELPFSTNKLIDGVSKEVPLTLSDMVAGLLLGGLALFAARNIPALLELTLLQRLPLSRASRYAFTTLTQYMVALAGLLITFNALGLQWSSVQWLVAALSVGLGFGLQEIVANFISGIILLFEQPIRVGDVVTVDNITGTVSRIRIRATTIVNWERQELIIPNKQFITGQLINWTLSDTVNRLTINVGVGYDSDTKQAMEIIAQVAADHPKVLKDPAPRISFEGFGDNSLNLVLRAYLNEIDSRLSTITELHQAILDRFRAVGIEIAFPQRDVHLDTSRPLELVLRRDAQTQAGES